MHGLGLTAQADVSRLEERVAELERALHESIRREQALRESEQRWRSMVEGSDDGGWEWHIPTGESYMSPSWFQMLGFEPGELPSNAETWNRLIHPDDAADVWMRLQGFLEGRFMSYQVEYRMRHKSGEWRWIMSRAKVFERDEQGRATRMTGTLRDITERRQMEEERAVLQERSIEAQRAALRELSTPLIPLGEDVVLMPLIGTIDSQRAEQLMTTLLRGVGEHQAGTVILDVTGVRVIDTVVADALVRASRAVSLLGALVVLTGIRPEVAQTLVSMGADLSTMVIHGSLRTGVAYALGRGAPRERPRTAMGQARRNTGICW